MKRLSVIIPAYNAEAFLAECVNSIIVSAQGCDVDTEIIIVNDGSRDDTSVVAHSLEQKFPHTVILVDKENEGVSIARNTGLNMATGEMVTFVDADDKVAVDYISVLSAESDKHDICFFSNNIFKDNEVLGQCLLKDGSFSNRADVEANLLPLKENQQGFEFYGYTWNKLFRRDIIERYNVRFPEGVIFREDEIFTSLYMQHVTSMRTISQPLYCYRKSECSLTSRQMLSDDFLQLARVVKDNIGQFENKELRSYELFRVLYMMYDALRTTDSFMTRQNIIKEMQAVVVNYYNEIPKDRLPWGLVASLHRGHRRAIMWMLKRMICKKL